MTQREELESEREFVDGTLSLLEPMVSAEEAAATAREAETTARDALRTTASQIAARRIAEQTRSRTTESEAEQAVDIDMGFFAGKVRRQHVRLLRDEPVAMKIEDRHDAILA